MIFVLVHGACHGGWCWKKVADLLCDRSTKVYTPTLTGLGERSHLLTESVNLTTHINDIVNLMEFEDLRQVILVGHSYAGFVIQGVAEQVPQRIARLIYFDSLVPSNGESVQSIRPDVIPDVTEISQGKHKVRVIMPPPPEMFLGNSPDAADIAWMAPRLSPHPYITFVETLKLDHSHYLQIPKWYFMCEQQLDPKRRLKSAGYDRAVGELWQRKIIPGPHDAMITHPVDLTEALIEIAG